MALDQMIKMLLFVDLRPFRKHRSVLLSMSKVVLRLKRPTRDSCRSRDVVQRTRDEKISRSLFANFKTKDESPLPPQQCSQCIP
jgi:hypothetical protein